MVRTGRIKGNQLDQVKKFKYLGSLLTGDRRFEQDIGTRISIAKEAFNKCKTILTKGPSRNLKKRLAKDLVWSELRCGSETIKKADAKRLDSHEIWIWRRLEKISLVD